MYDKLPIVHSKNINNGSGKDGKCCVQPFSIISPSSNSNIMMDATAPLTFCQRSSLSSALLQPQQRHGFLLHHRQVCILSVVAAFAFGLAVGVIVPALSNSNGGMSIEYRISRASGQRSIHKISQTVNRSVDVPELAVLAASRSFEDVDNNDDRQLQSAAAQFSMINDNSSKLFLNHSRRKVSRFSSKLMFPLHHHSSTSSLPITRASLATSAPLHIQQLIDDDIYWGPTVEHALPTGFLPHETADWTAYLRTSIVTKIEPGCGRMQNRLVHFQDGRRACARYRQNTDQIQGELFSFYLGRLLNITNLAPSAAIIVDLRSAQWQRATGDIVAAQWRSQRPVVLTQWLPDLEAASIPAPFQPLEQHFNRVDVQNIATAAATEDSTATTNTQHHQPKAAAAMLRKLVELAQWSDLIVFDYLIANLDRVVNNLYNYQWNADIMAAPAHNLAQQRSSALLVFLDNESGLLHGYRLLQKYEAYHGVLLDNLCVFRRSTIDALHRLRRPRDGDAADDGNAGAGGIAAHLQSVFESTTGPQLREVLPALPVKSIQILGDRIERVLGQVRKCRAQFTSR